MKPFLAAGVFFTVLIVVVAGAWKTITMNRIGSSYESWTATYPTRATNAPLPSLRDYSKPPNVKLSYWTIVPGRVWREVVGEIENTNLTAVSHVEVQFDGLDSSGAIVRSLESSHNNLQPGERWKFRISILEERVQKLKLKFVGNPYAD